jgi:hypothetical protein
MDFVNEQNGALASFTKAFGCSVNRVTNIFDPGCYR